MEGRGDKFGTDDSWISEKDREFIIDHGVLIIQVQSGIHNLTVVADGRYLGSASGDFLLIDESLLCRLPSPEFV